MSSKTLKGGLAALKKSDLAMIHYNQEYCEEEEIIQLAQKEKKGILIKKAFQNGYLAAVKDEAEKKEILRNNIDFILKNPAVSSIIIGTVDLKHLQENVSFFLTLLFNLGALDSSSSTSFFCTIRFSYFYNTINKKEI